jgi:hypothetical protein
VEVVEVSDLLVEYRKDREFREYQQQPALSAQDAAQLSEMLQGSNIALQETAVEYSDTWSNRSSSRLNHRDDVKFISTKQETQCRISLSKITESSATCELSPSWA